MASSYVKFQSLKPAKRERIVVAAMKEFAHNGFEKASTNKIIKEARISKGSLFAYFNTKKELYLFLLDRVVDIIHRIYDEVDVKETDLFKRIRDIGLCKYMIYKQYPHAFHFLKAVANEEAREVKAEIEKTGRTWMSEGFEKIYTNIDLTRFRDDIDIQRTINIINWTMLNFAEQQRNAIGAIEEYDMDQFTEWDHYADIMKRCFYKKQED